MASGGDEQIARRNFETRDTYFTIDTTFMFMGNNELKYDTKDCIEHRIDFQSANQFKSQQEIDKMKADGASDLLIASYNVKDSKIKDLCKTEAWRKATIYLIYQHYVADELMPDARNVEDDEDEITLRQRILENFENTREGDDVIFLSDVNDVINDCKKKIKVEFESMGVFAKKSNIRGPTKNKLCYFGLKRKLVIDTENENAD